MTHLPLVSPDPGFVEFINRLQVFVLTGDHRDTFPVLQSLGGVATHAGLLIARQFIVALVAGTYRPHVAGGGSWHERRLAATLADAAAVRNGVPAFLRRLNLSRSHADAIAKRAFGASLATLVMRARLEHACHLLLTGTQSVKEIAYAVGFKNPAHFSRRFRRGFGLAPTRYREICGSVGNTDKTS